MKLHVLSQVGKLYNMASFILRSWLPFVLGGVYPRSAPPGLQVLLNVSEIEYDIIHVHD